MSPLELLRKGILSQNWQEVSEAYTDLTGEELRISQEKPKVTPRKYKYICQNPSCKYKFEWNKPRKACPKCRKRKLKSRSKKRKSKRINNKQTSTFNTKQKSKSVSGKQPLQIQEMQYIDLEDEGREYEEIDEILYKNVKPQKREREPAKKVQVTCRECHKKYKVAPILAPGTGRSEYVCDKCLIGRGSSS